MIAPPSIGSVAALDRAVGYLVHRAPEPAGLVGRAISPHSLRHTYAIGPSGAAATSSPLQKGERDSERPRSGCSLSFRRKGVCRAYLPIILRRPVECTVSRLPRLFLLKLTAPIADGRDGDAPTDGFVLECAPSSTTISILVRDRMTTASQDSSLSTHARRSASLGLAALMLVVAPQIVGCCCRSEPTVERAPLPPPPPPPPPQRRGG
jgi:hypothetical protein